MTLAWRHGRYSNGEFMSILISAAKRVRPSIREDAANMMRWAATRRATRQVLGAVYGRLSYPAKAELHSRFSRIFRDEQMQVEPGTWNLTFLGRRLRIPIQADRAWLDWDTALSLLGHETEIKSTYEHILRARSRPELFIDIGANYGGHSLLFASQGVECVAFEPNEVCHTYIEELVALNNVRIDLRPVAIGDEAGTLDLCFPPTEAWLGTVNTKVRKRLENSMPITIKQVPVLTLDGALSEKVSNRMLIKIDVEGAELSVLRGAKRTIQENGPLILVECFAGSPDRVAIFDFLTTLDYGMARLPWDGVSTPEWLKRTEFVADPGSNYLAAGRKL